MQSSTPESAIPRPPTSLCSGLGPEQKAGTFAPTITERNDLIDIEAGVEVLVSDSPVAMRGLSCACQPIGRTQMRYSGAPGPRCRVACTAGPLVNGEIIADLLLAGPSPPSRAMVGRIAKEE